MKPKRYSRWIMVDGQPVHLYGCGELTQRDIEALSEIARAARRKMEEVMRGVSARREGLRNTDVTAGDASA